MELHEAPPNSASLFNDPTPNEIILNRIVVPMMDLITNYSDFREPERSKAGSDLIDLVTIIARKMWSVWKHAKDYHAIENRLVEEYSKIEIPNHVLFSQELYEEFDVFSVQIKSTLDHLAWVFRPIFRGEKNWTVYTFHDCGTNVMNELKSLKKYKGHASLLERTLYTAANQKWIESIVGSRDRMNHFKNGGIDIRHVAIARNPDGSVRVPMWVEGQALGTMIDITWLNFFHFVEDFLVLSIRFRMPDKYSMLRTERPLSTNQSAWAVIPLIEAKPPVIL
jgi:hypothetical protein